MMSKWLRSTLQRKERYRMIVPEIDDLQGVGIMLADRLEEWALGYIAQGKKEGLTQGIQQGVQQGMQQGMQQGEARVLVTLLTKRFGPIPVDYSTLITAASQEQIELWLDRILEVSTLENLFTRS
jgi:flagellar biosynthesis/type III secretory pathway protein FliH